MKFGVNNNINSIEKRYETPHKQSLQNPETPLKQSLQNPENQSLQNPENQSLQNPEKTSATEVSDTGLLTTSLIIAFVLRFAWMAL